MYNTLLVPALLFVLSGAPVDVALAGDNAAPAAEEYPLKDAVIKSKILASYALDRNVSAMALDVQVDHGVVLLGGRAKTSTERDLAVEIARGTEGVKDVSSNIAVAAKGPDDPAAPKRSVGEVIDDAGLTATVKAKLIANSNTPAHRISVTTRNGIVTLTGSVDTPAQKELAGKLAQNTGHVARVDNEITVSQR